MAEGKRLADLIYVLWDLSFMNHMTEVILNNTWNESVFVIRKSRTVQRINWDKWIPQTFVFILLY